jgi:CRISPR associated protein
LDYTLTKPASATGYASHRLVAGLLQGQSAQFVDRGNHLLIRTEQTIAGAAAVELPAFSTGSIHGFSLRASTGTKTKGRHRYWPTRDWQSRHAWLERKARLHGFEVIAVHCTACLATIEKAGGNFTIDQTDFTGVLKVLTVDLFAQALHTGVGSTGKAFGMGMLRL